MFRRAPTTEPSSPVRMGVGAADSAAGCTPSALPSRPPTSGSAHTETGPPMRSPCFARCSRLLSAIKARRSWFRFTGSLSRMTNRSTTKCCQRRIRARLVVRAKTKLNTTYGMHLCTEKPQAIQIIVHQTVNRVCSLQSVRGQRQEGQAVRKFQSTTNADPILGRLTVNRTDANHLHAPGRLLRPIQVVVPRSRRD